MSGRRITEYLHETLGLQTKAARRYGDRSMRRDSQRGKGFAERHCCRRSCALQQSRKAKAKTTLNRSSNTRFDLHQRAQFTEAIPLLEQARRLEPGDYFTNLLLGIDLLRTGKASRGAAVSGASRHTPGLAKRFPRIIWVRPTRASDGTHKRHTTTVARSKAGMAQSRHLKHGPALPWRDFTQIGESLRATEAGVATVQRLVAAAAKPATSLTCEGSIPALEHTLALDESGLRTKAEMETAYKLSICYAVEAGNAASQLQEGEDDASSLHRLRGDVLLRLKGDRGWGGGRSIGGRSLCSPATPRLLERLAEAQLSRW